MRHRRMLLLSGLLILASACARTVRHEVTVKIEPAKKPESPPPAKTGPLPEEVQREARFHEAGHAIVAAVVRGSWYVHDIVVCTENCVHYYGLVTPVDHRRHYRLGDFTKEAAFCLGGLAAEKVLLGEFTGAVEEDLRNANRLFRRKHARLGMGRSLLVYKDDQPLPAAVQRDVESDVTDAAAYAEQIIRSNVEHVRALADRLGRQPIRDGKRRLTAEEFRLFLQGRRLFDPRED